MKRFLVFLLLISLLSALGVHTFAAEESELAARELSVPERIIQVVGLVILFGGIALLPLYFVLDARRKKIRRSFAEKPEDQPQPEETPSDKDA